MSQTTGKPTSPRRGRRLRSKGLGPRFGALFFSQAVSFLGNYVAYLTLPLFVVELLGLSDAAPFSFTYALETIPTLIFGLAGGALLDRLRLRPAMIASDLIRAAAFFYLALGVDDVGFVTVLALSFVVGSFSAVWENALYSVIPHLVSRSDLPRANSLVAGTQSVAFAVGPVVAGVIYVWGGAAPGFWFNGATFVASAICLLFIGSPDPNRGEATTSFVEETMNGIRFLIGERRLRDATFTAAAANLVLGFVEGTFVLLGAIVLGTSSESDLGVLIALFGIGGTAGAALADRVIRWLGLGRTLTVGLFVMASSMLLLVQSRFGLIALAFAGVTFLGIALVNVSITTMRQVYTPPSMLGRVVTASRALAWGTLPIGALMGAWVADSLDYATVIRATPLFLLAIAVWLRFTPLWRDAFGPTYRFADRRLRTPGSDGKHRGAHAEDGENAAGENHDT